MENNYIVYIHISPNNKKYIGLTSQKLENRWRNGKGYKNNTYFYRAIEKYGWDNFQHIIIARGLTEDEAKWLEVELIREWDTTNQEKGYNLTKGGEGTNGWTPSKETREKISKANKGLKRSEETKQKMSENRWDNSGENHPMFGLKGELNPNFGRKNTEETKQKMSENHWDCSGENNPMYGKHHSEETKEKISKANSEDNHPQARIIILLNTKEIFLTEKESAKKYNTYGSNISRCCNGKAKSAGKLKDGTPLVWMFYDEYLQITEEEVKRKLRDADTRVILLNTNEVFLTITEGAIKYNVQKSNITNCCKGKLKSAGKHPITGEKLIWIYYYNIEYRVL